jgi:ATP-dependent helicase/nuclease subunit A
MHNDHDDRITTSPSPSGRGQGEGDSSSKSNSLSLREREPELELPDTQARRAALDPTRSFIVQAPAGSGKTELLTQRYLRLLTTVEQPEQILAITFTRKAASEMRNRILQSLSRARTTARPEKQHEAQNWDLAQAALQTDQQRGWQIESHPARLRIQTIDSLNASLARRLPMLAGMGASMEIAQDQWPIYEAVCERLLEQLGDGSDESLHLETVLKHLANRVPSFMDMLCELLARRDHWLPLLIRHRNDVDLRDSIEHTLQAAIEHHLHNLQAALPADTHAELVELAALGARNRLQNGAKESDVMLLEACSELSQLPPVSAVALNAWRGIAMLVCKSDGDFYKSLTKTQGFPTETKEAKTRMLTLLNDLRDIPGLAELFTDLHTLPSPVFSDAQWQVLQALLQLLPKAVQELMVEFQSGNQVDYVELSLRALQALGTPEQPTDTALALDARLQHILVDEFQDTSVSQMSLLNMLTAGWSEGDGRTLFCVGDPMQSIYRFRQAEVGLFLQMQQHGLPDVAVTALQLQTNFRSTQPIVSWVNSSFPHIMPLHDDAELGAVRYSPSLPRPDAAATGWVKTHAAIERSAQTEAQQIRALVQESLAADVRQNIAILVASRNHVGAIARELKQAGIAFNAVDIERLKDRSLVQDLMALTRALLHVGDRTAWLACLRAPWCGLSLVDMHALVAGDEQQTVWSLIQIRLSDEDGFDKSNSCDASISLSRQQRLQRFAAVMKAALTERARHSLRDWVEQTWLALNGPACLTAVNELDDAEAYFARLDELEMAGDLEDLARLQDQLNNLFASSGDSANARVEIMTIHKSKGLEFDVVILPSLHRTGGKDSTKLLRWTRLTGLDADGLVLAPPGARGDDHDSIYQWLTTLEKQRARYESQRLLYVAVTRAKRELHLFGSASLNKDGDAPKEPRSGTLLKLLWPQVRSEFVHAIAARPVTAMSNVSLMSMSLRRLPLNWSPPAPVAALPGRKTNNVINAVEQPEFDWVGETSRHVGTVVHAELERLVKLSRDQMQQWNAATRKLHLLLRLAELGVPEALRDQACERVIKAVERTLSDAKGRWILGLDATHREAASEIALTGVLNGLVVNGIIDRSFVDSDGVRWIIDFKTSTHEGGGREAFLQAEVERYRTQLQRYARLMQLWKPDQPIKAALYFPLMSEWCEIS